MLKISKSMVDSPSACALGYLGDEFILRQVRLRRDLIIRITLFEGFLVEDQRWFHASLHLAGRVRVRPPPENPPLTEALGVNASTRRGENDTASHEGQQGGNGADLTGRQMRGRRRKRNPRETRAVYGGRSRRRWEERDADVIAHHLPPQHLQSNVIDRDEERAF